MLGIKISSDKVDGIGGKVARAQRQRMTDAADAGFALSQEEVPGDRGTLQQSGYPPTWEGGSIHWGYRARHAWPMEDGTEPGHTPPVGPLMDWGERVAGDRGLGWYVARIKAPREGIDAQPYARPGRDRQKQYLKTHPFSEYLERQL